MPLFLLANWKWLLSGAMCGLLAWYGTSLSYRIDIKEIEKQQADQATDAMRQQLAQFTADADKIHEAAGNYVALTSGLDTRFSVISKDFANAVKSHPLPRDCRPDADRVRALSAAVSAANSVAGLNAVPAVPAVK